MADGAGALTIFHTTAFPWQNATLTSSANGTDVTTEQAAGAKSVSTGSRFLCLHCCTCPVW